MIKCTEAIFTESSPSTFFRKHKRQNSSEQQHEITESQIIEKIQLILISMREESSKASSYLGQQNKKLQSQVNYQGHLNNLLEQENLLLAQFLQMYVEKYGQICPQIHSIQKIKAVRSHFCEENSAYQHDQIIQNGTINTQKRNHSNLSTNYISHYQNQQNQEHLTQAQSEKTSASQNLLSSYHSMSGTLSTISNFHKKTHPFNQQTINKTTNFNPNFLQLESKRLSPQISEISQVETLQNSKIQSLLKENEESQSYDLGLQSKGSNFFRRQSFQVSDNYENDEKNDEIGNYQINGENESFVPEQIGECSRQEGAFESLKTDSDIKRMKLVLENNFGNRQDCHNSSKKLANNYSNELTNKEVQFLREIPTNEQKLDGKELKTFNHSYFKSLDFYGKRKEENDSIMQKGKQWRSDKSGVECMRKQLRMVESKLKALFEPFPSSVVSKKVCLPRMNEELKNHCARKSVDLERFNQFFNPLQTKAPQSVVRKNTQNRKRNNLHKRIL